MGVVGCGAGVGCGWSSVGVGVTGRKRSGVAGLNRLESGKRRCVGRKRHSLELGSVAVRETAVDEEDSVVSEDREVSEVEGDRVEGAVAACA